MKPAVISKPHLIIMIGIPRSGKSFFAEHFADTFKAPIISFDKLRNEIFSNPSFTKDEDIIINKVANNLLGEVLKTKRTVIYDGQTNLRAERIAISKIARDADYDPLFIWVQTEPASAKKRALKTNVEKPAIDDNDFENLLKHFSAPHRNEKAIVISGKHTYASQLKIVLKNLVQPHEVKNEQVNIIHPPKRRNYLIR